MTTPDGLPPLREVIAALGLSARKQLGQNFILDLNLTRRIARTAGPLEGVTVIEIGPGPGGLTRALLLEGAGEVIAIERDPRCLPALEAIAAHYPGRLTIIEGDALEVDQPALAAQAAGPVRIVANLPYSVATPLLVGWLSAAPWPPWYEMLCLMFQREVAERLTAGPGTKTYGRLSVLAQWRCRVRLAFHVPPAAFTPAPKVSSAVVTLHPRATPEPRCRLDSLTAVTAAAFGQRRKMMRASLGQLVRNAEALLAEARIPLTARAEQLGVEDFARLAQVYEARGSASTLNEPG
ncbi:MAG: 16S rRNA (adenine(1518)-N(6)/adenine(1519)-N(6))-dimethyltransferase RsmA [Dichotomicrobium sp.]